MLLRLILLTVIVLPNVVMAKQAASEPEVIIILDDLGYRSTDLAAFALPSEVTFSILPATPLARPIAQRAHREGRAVMLHMPMQASSDKAMGPLGLSTDMYPAAITHTLRRALKSVPFAVGVNNHMGSAFTGKAEAMQTLMEEIKRQGLFFVDSRTSVYTRGQEMAEALGVPTASRQIFLDHQQTQAFLQQQFEKTKALARRKGHAVVIAHPYPQTLRFLADALPTLKAQGIRLTSVADYLDTPAKPAVEAPYTAMSAPNE